MKIIHKKRPIIFIVLICIITIACCLYKLTFKKKTVLDCRDQYLFFLSGSNKENTRNLIAYDLNKDSSITITDLPYMSAKITFDNRKAYITVPTTYTDDKKLGSKIYMYDMETGNINSTKMAFHSISSFYNDNKLITYGQKDKALYLAIGQGKKVEYLKVKDDFKAFTAAILKENLYLTSKDLVIKYDLKTNKIVKEFPLGKAYDDVIITVKDEEIILAASKGNTEILSLTNNLDIKDRSELPGIVIDMIAGKNSVLINSVNVLNNESTLYAMKDKNITKIKYDKVLKIGYRGGYYAVKQQFLLPQGNTIISINENSLTINMKKVETAPWGSLTLKS